MPESKNLFDYTFQIIQKLLKGQYNKNTPFFICTVQNNPDTFSETLFINNYDSIPEIILDQKYNFNNYQYRIIQTKINISVFIKPDFKALLISNDHFFLYVLDSKSAINFKLTLDAQITDDQFNSKKINKNQLTDLKENKVILSNCNINKRDDLKKVITKEVAEEKKKHILQNINSFDFNFLKKIDELWNELDCITTDGNLSSSGSRETDRIRQVLLNEIAKLTDTSFIKINPDFDIKSPFNLWNSWNNKETHAPIQIQEIWNKLSFPIQGISLNRFNKRFPIEIIALFLWGNFYNYFWKKHLAQKLIYFFSTVDKNCELLFKILFELSEKYSFFDFSNTIVMRSNQVPGFYALETKEKEILNINQNKQTHYTFRFKSYPKIKIDKPVQITYSNNNIIVIPSYNHIKDYGTNVCAIKISTLEIVISLAWRQFTVWIAGCRFKFLLKKNRYQISVRSPQKDVEISLNGEKIYFENRYKKYYLDIIKHDFQPDFQIFDKSGFLYSNKSDFFLFNNELLFYPNTISRNGIIPENILLKTEDSQKPINLVKNYNSVLFKIPHKIENGSMIFPKTGKKRVRLEVIPTIHFQLMETTVAELIVRLGIFCDPILESECKKLIKNYWDLNFNIYKISDLSYYNFDLNLYICEKGPDQETPFFKVTSLKDHASKKVLHFSLNSFNNWLDRYFFNI